MINSTFLWGVSHPIGAVNKECVFGSLYRWTIYPTTQLFQSLLEAIVGIPINQPRYYKPYIYI